MGWVDYSVDTEKLFGLEERACFNIDDIESTKFFKELRFESDRCRGHLPMPCWWLYYYQYSSNYNYNSFENWQEDSDMEEDDDMRKLSPIYIFSKLPESGTEQD